LGVQITWTLFSGHWPKDLDFLSGRFVERFARYARAVASRVAEIDPRVTPVFAPVSEPSFMAWSLFSAGRIRRIDGSRAEHPEIKRQLARAAIEASYAILSAVPRARLLHTDPLEHVVAPLDRPALAGTAARRNELQFEGWDMIAGRSAKELGGEPRFLDLVGANYYAESQWELGSGNRLAWQFDDPRRLPLGTLLKTLHARYRRPIVIAETGHSGVRRGAWVREVATEVRDAIRIGVPVEGICVTPLIDQRDARRPGLCLRRGLWDTRLEVSRSYAASLFEAQRVTRRAACADRPELPIAATVS
jgi:hypothetical protein